MTKTGDKLSEGRQSVSAYVTFLGTVRSEICCPVSEGKLFLVELSTKVETVFEFRSYWCHLIELLRVLGDWSDMRLGEKCWI